MAALEVAARALPLAKDGQPTATATRASLQCPTYTLPPGGVLSIDDATTITLTAHALFTPLCTVDRITDAGIQGGDIIPLADYRDPFHASITPQAYATGAATVIAWMLVIMLIITPRTFFVGGATGRSGLMGRRGMISGATGGGSVIGVGTRPWLQKVAALTVAISLTVATADTFKYAARQYAEGLINADDLRRKVATSVEIKVSRVISDVFVWLAQVQTLIRLFPRHKEKVLIKWIGFALIVLDITFSCLKHFGPYEDSHQPLHFETAIPALNYLFQLSLSMLYAAWVLYYAITKRRYAFWHDMMWNISVVAVLSVVAILTPVVFFIIDITNETIAGWGDYFRWVGAAAASVIVWEWVERIEALEREERKDGILGREIYDGDEMLETTPSHEIWPRKRGKRHSNDEDERKAGDGGYGQSIGSFSTGTVSGFSALGHKFTVFSRPRQKQRASKEPRTIRIPAPPPARKKADLTRRSARSDPPVPQITSPVNRAETASADSTVYAIRYHPIDDAPAGTHNTGSSGGQSGSTAVGEMASAQKSPTSDPEKGFVVEPINQGARSKGWWSWQLPSIFRRYGWSPPPEVQRGQVIEPLGVDDISTSIPQRNYAGLALRDRLGTFAAQQGERFRSKKNTGSFDDSNLPVTIIPAHPRGRTWSPEQIAQLGQEQIAAHDHGSSPAAPPAPTTSVSPGFPRTDTTGSRTTATGRVRDTPDGTTVPSPIRRNSHVRFAPEVLQRPAERLQADHGRRASSLSPNSASLGRGVNEVSQPRPQPSVLGNEVAAVDHTQPRMDHER